MWTNLNDDGGDDGFDGARDVGAMGDTGLMAGGEKGTVGSGDGMGSGGVAGVSGSSSGGSLLEMDDDIFDDEFEYVGYSRVVVMVGNRG